MTRKTLVILTLLVVLLVSTFGTVGAEGIDDPTATPEVDATETVEETEVVEEPDGELAGTKFFTHPVVQILSAYFDRDWQADEDVVTEGTPEADVTPVAGETPVAEETPESGLGPIGEQIAALHEEGMGFGVLVKIFAIAEAAEACAPVAVPEGEVAVVAEGEESDCVYVTAEELVAAVKGGEGMGQLFKTYGKPALLGVGHVKKAVKKLQVTEVVVEPVIDVTPSADDLYQLDAKGNKHLKAPKAPKGNNGKGPNK